VCTADFGAPMMVVTIQQEGEWTVAGWLGSSPLPVPLELLDGKLGKLILARSVT